MADKATGPVYINFNRLDHLLEVKGRKWQFLHDSGISSGTVAKMKGGSGYIDTQTMQKVCMLLDCQPDDIMKYIPDQSYP